MVLLNRKPLKNKIGGKIIQIFLDFFPQKMSPVSRIVPETLQCPLGSQNILFLVKIEGSSDENSRIVPKKRRSQKN